MNMHQAIASLNQPKSLIRRTQPRDFVESFWNPTFSRPLANDVLLEVYENDDDKWFVISTPVFSGWTTDPSAAFYIANNAFVYTFDELEWMAKHQAPHTDLLPNAAYLN